jgi:C-terminal processing protease CtpA/Prc
VKPSAALLLLSLIATTGAKEVPPPKEKPVELEPLRVHEKPIISFAVDIVVFSRPEDRTVNKIFVERVLPETDAARAGLQPGDEIVKLGGQPVKGLDAVVAAGHPLGRLLLGRDVGDPLAFEFFTVRRKEYTLHAIAGKPVTFGVDIGITLSTETKRVDRAFITRVRPGSDAENAGLRAEDEISTLDGLPVAGMDPGVSADSQLGRLLLGRSAGDPLKLGIVTGRTQEFTLRAQRGQPWDH